MKRLVSCQQGFTFLEMLLAMGLLAMIRTAFMAAMSAAGRQWQFPNLTELRFT